MANVRRKSQSTNKTYNASIRRKVVVNLQRVMITLNESCKNTQGCLGMKFSHYSGFSTLRDYFSSYKYKYEQFVLNDKKTLTLAKSKLEVVGHSLPDDNFQLLVNISPLTLIALQQYSTPQKVLPI